ncbi:hypothetical protein GINT2_000496 [Glugoides intestinalis]
MTFSNTSEITNNRRDKIHAFIEKDIFTLNNYETAPFKNKNHAIECLIPYHIFHLTADDIKFRGSDIEIDLEKVFAVANQRIKKFLHEHTFDNEGFTPQLLLYHEQRFMNSIAQQAKEEKDAANEKTVDRRFLSVRIPKYSLCNAYGMPLRPRIKVEKHLRIKVEKHLNKNV